MFGFGYQCKNGLSSESVEELYQLFLQKYLKYRNYDFFFNMDIFDNVREQWFQKILKSDKPNLEQKILEVLAIHPKLTFEELVEKTEESRDDVRNCLSGYTLESYKPLVEKTVYIQQNITGKANNKKYWDFLLHSTIRVEENRKDYSKTYELSLFGLILALTLIRYYDMDKLKQGLYYNNISFVDYYDAIASKYRDKLPLIFGKWHLLKDILGIYSDYNFDVIVDKEIHSRDSNKLSIMRGGNKELYDSVREIVLQTRQQLGELANSGWVILLNGPDNTYKDYFIKDDADVLAKPDPYKVNAIVDKINEIIFILNPLESAFYESISSSVEFIKKTSYYLERLFANEITAFYYFHLYYDFEFHSRYNVPMKYLSSVNQVNTSPKSSTPKKCLSSILKNDNEKPMVREWLNGWMQNIVSLQKEISEALEFKI